uniref:NTF2 domain-containing protein n=1 Tax=Petromyzon marinus TaxID=7757 RepID=S4RK99_PETMA
MMMMVIATLLSSDDLVTARFILSCVVGGSLRRFYGKDSTFVHGGVDANGKPSEPVVGQMEIHARIVSLAFRDCRTKIRAVDSQATMGGAVVVQVLGELSNAGGAMRRFLQTFILAPEGSVQNKFFVQNDIFRYQDEVFTDSDHSEGTETHR